MIDALFNQPSYVAATKLIDATAVRHEAIASNLANLETPNYKRLDLAPSFKDEFARAVESGQVERLRALHPSLATDSNARPANRDGNTVQLESELFQLSQNTLTHSLATQLVTRSLQKLRTAISSRLT